MKKLVCVLSLLLVLSLVFEVVAEEPHKTEFDRYTYGSYITTFRTMNKKCGYWVRLCGV